MTVRTRVPSCFSCCGTKRIVGGCSATVGLGAGKNSFGVIPAFSRRGKVFA